jgi:hypothetical protein
MAEEKKLNLYQKLAEIKKNVEVLQKTKAGHGYKYVPEDEILASVNLGMKKQGVSLVPKIVPSTMSVTPYHYISTKVLPDGKPYDKHNNEVIVQADMEWEWINNESPDEKILVPWALIAQQADASQAFGGALTYSSRFFLLKYFNTATVDSDPDNYRSQQQGVDDREKEIILKSTIDKIAKTVNEYLEANKEDANAQPLMSEYLKSVLKIGGKATSNYNAIKEVEVASDLLSKVTEYCMKTKMEDK